MEGTTKERTAAPEPKKRGISQTQKEIPPIDVKVALDDTIYCSNTSVLSFTDPSLSLSSLYPSFSVEYNRKGFIGGNLGYHLSSWEEITSDPWVLDQVKGVKPELLSAPIQYFIPKEINWSPNEIELIDDEINSFLANKTIRKCTKNEHDKDQFISNIFFRYKSNGAIRLILNLKPFNIFVKDTHFKMGGLADAINLTCRNCYFTSIDLKDAFYSVPLHQSAKKYFRFYHKSELYEFNSLVMGYKDAPRIFTKISKPLLGVLREHNIQIMMYIDDALLVHSDFDTGIRATEETIRLMTQLGFFISWDKSCLLPTQQIKYLGFLIDSVNMSVRPTDEKALAVKEECRKTMLKQKITIRKLSELIGKFVALCPGNRYGTIYYKRSENEKTELLKANAGNFDAKFTLTDTIKDDLSWWSENVCAYPVYIQLTLPEVEITCDSSTTGWAGICNSVTTQGLWSVDEQTDHINVLEIKAALLSLKAFTAQSTNISVKIFSDNICTVLCINKQGSTKRHINDLIREIWLYCMERNLFLKALHVPGVDNEADKESRNKGVETEWELREK